MNWLREHPWANMSNVPAAVVRLPAVTLTKLSAWIDGVVSGSADGKVIVEGLMVNLARATMVTFTVKGCCATPPKPSSGDKIKLRIAKNTMSSFAGQFMNSSLRGACHLTIK